MKVSFTIDDIRLKTKLKTNETLNFTEKCFLYTILGFTHWQSSALNNHPEGYIQLIPGTYKSNEPISITGFDESPLSCDWINCRIGNNVREPILFSFALNKPPGHKIYKKPRKKNLFKW